MISERLFARFKRWLNDAVNKTYGEVEILPPRKSPPKPRYSPNTKRTREVFEILDSAPDASSYDKLQEFVFQVSGVRCSRKLVAKWHTERGTRTRTTRTASGSRNVHPIASVLPEKRATGHASAPVIIITASILLFSSCQTGDRSFARIAQAKASPPADIKFSDAPQTESAKDESGSERVPKVFRIELTVSRVEDLKVSINQHVNAGDVLTDRLIERAPLEQALRQAEIQLAMMVHPKHLPQSRIAPAFFDDVEAQITRAEKAEKEAKLKVETLAARISALEKLKDLPASVASHEAATRAQLERDAEQASRELTLAQNQLENSKAQRQTAEYMTARDNVIQTTMENNAIQSARMSATQAQATINSLKYQIALLGVVRAPFSGTVKRIAWEGQQDHDIKVILSLAVDSDTADVGDAVSGGNGKDGKGNKTLGATRRMRPHSKGFGH